MKIEVITEKLGLSLEHGIPTGNIKGYRYSVAHYAIDTFVKVPMMHFVFEKGLSKEDMKAIQKTTGMGQVRFESIALNNNVALIMFKHGFKNNEKHQDFLERCAQTFESLGLRSLNHCPFCGQEDTDSQRIIKNSVVKVHDACAKNFYQEIAKKVEEQESSNDHIVKSLIYAFLGAIVGAIPTFISIVFFQYMLAILYALIPLASFYGYKYGGAPRKSWVPIAVSVMSLVIVIVMTWWVYNAIAVAEGVLFSQAMQIEEFSSSFYSDLGTSILFLGIGVWISWRQMYKQTTTAIKKNFEGLK